ncbi:UNVERIFIED_CONTAM: hypothetical protein GTU68_044244, partial [Idotea baltica]|nr:hypothetical protein [Idotea baltica]
MDAFFASVEQRDNPELIGKPVIVGGNPDSRGVVAAASYEARKFGIHSAMSSSRAYKLCPNAIFIKPRFLIYKRISRMILGILKNYSDFVEPLSIDEAFLDVTRNKKGHYYASRVAKEIRAEIFSKTGLTASAGIAPNKFLAKIASDLNKPNGLSVIMPDEIYDFLTNLPVRKIPGIGKVAERKLLTSGITKVGELREKSEEKLTLLFGKSGSWFHQLSHGIDNREIIVNRERKSVGAERTFLDDILNIEFLKEKLFEISEELIKRLKNNNFSGRTLSLKVTYSDFTKISRA